MRCRDVDALASAYIDGELDDARAGALRGHARMCERCASTIEDLALLREEAARLELLEPPPGLWARIEGGLARAEIADAQRSRLWLRWQGIRPMLLPGAVALAALAALFVWLIEPGQQAGTLLDNGAGDGPDEQSLALAPGDTADLWAAREAEIRAADARYRTTLEELHALVAEERASWPAELGTVFDRRVADFKKSLERAAPLGSLPDHHDELHAVYRAEIEFLQSVVVDGVVEADSTRGVLEGSGPEGVVP